MKNFFLSIIIIAVAAFALQQFLPWWTIAIAAFAVGYFVKQKSGMAFLSGFLAVFLLWLVWAFVLSSVNEHILAGKIAVLMEKLTGGSTVVLFILTGLLGGLVSGFAALTGRLAARLKD